jgi:sec-independent protein translocase protein TatC
MNDAEPEFLPEDGDTGARKSFWEHLQDLRTAIVRSGIAVGLALMICLLFDARIVAILEYPLRRVHMFEKPKTTVTLELGTTKFGPTVVSSDDFPNLPPEKGNYTVHIGVAKIGQQLVFTPKLDPHPSTENEMEVRLHNLSPAEAFFVAFHVAMYAAFAISSPFWIYFLGSFILPAFKRSERQIVFSWLGWGIFLFFLGVLSTYFVLLPVALRASMKYSELLGFSAADWRADEYINFVCKFLLGMGVGFQFPLVVLFLVKVGLVTHRQLAHFRRHVIVLSLVLGALLTTPEVITQVAMAVPLYLLYEICIWIAWYWDWKKRRAEPKSATGT